jgi:hypothetical protein
LISLPPYDITADFTILVKLVDDSRVAVVRNLPLARRQLEQGGDPQRFLLLLADVNEAVAAAYAQRDEGRFKEALELAIEYEPRSAGRLTPTKELYATLFSLELIVATGSAVAAMAERVRRARLAMPGQLIGYVTEMLALVEQLDRPAVRKLCEDLRSGSTERRFSRLDAEFGLLWATAGDALIDRDGEALVGALKAIERGHHRFVQKAATAWSKGRDVDFSIGDFLLAPAAGLTALGQIAGLIPAAPLSPYFDTAWIRRAV